MNYGDIYIQGTNGSGVVVTRGSRTSTDPVYDCNMLHTFIELEQAHRLRKVTIEPHALGALILVSPDVSFFKLATLWLSARREARANATKRKNLP